MATGVEYVINTIVATVPWSILVSTKQMIRCNTKTFLGLCIGCLGREYLGGSVRYIFFQRRHNMPLFNGPVAKFLRKYKLVRRTALLGGALVGLYFLGTSQGWWEFPF
jgi:hypothetical protein